MTKFDEYFDLIQLPMAIRERVLAVLAEIDLVSPEEIDAIFVGNQLADNGASTYTGLWAFSQRFVAESLAFLQNNSFELTTYAKAVYYLRVHAQSYVIGTQPTPEARLVVAAHLEEPGGYELIMSATGSNCLPLSQVLLARLKPNVRARS